ncbi:MAG TPA: TetR/AcrR family transcriptional regulator [Mycobacteriales bacterium]|nr:TetR/AcrR family transcriptional regulator [Mycobacteriales bacterium]
MTTTAPRRELLLKAAADLFAARGYHAVGIDDIGEAAGITGPGVYRHFSSKQALLQSLCDLAVNRMLDAARSAEGLEALVDLHVSFVVRERALIRVWLREQWSLEKEARRASLGQLRSYEAVWREALGRRRPDLPEAEVALVVSSVLGMLNTTSHVDSALSQDERREALTRLALAALRG